MLGDARRYPLLMNMEQLAFQYCLRFEQFVNPRNTKMLLEEALRVDAIVANGMACLVGTQGGMKYSYGVIFASTSRLRWLTGI